MSERHKTTHESDLPEGVKPIEALGAKKGKIHYGGQAVIEGVMMRGPRRVAVAVRLPSGELDVHSEEFVSVSRRHRFLRLPVIRGGLTLIESLALGIKALNYSAGAAMEAEPEEKKGKTDPSKTEQAKTDQGTDGPEADESAGVDRGDAELTEPEQAGAEPSAVPEEAASEGAAPSKLGHGDWKTKAALTGTMVFAFALGILFFFYIPLVLSDQLTRWLGSESTILFNAVDGVIRVVFFLLYIWGISQWREMRRVFEYHGAEHKTIFCHEAGDELTPTNAQKYTTRHPRCGTSFLLIVMVVSILVFMLTGRPQTVAHRLLRLLLIPVIAGVSYEIMKLSAIHGNSRWARAVSAPGVWLQGITTKPPSDQQVEVAIAALEAARKGDPRPGEETDKDRDGRPAARDVETSDGGPKPRPEQPVQDDAR